MVRKYLYGSPFRTDAVVKEIPTEKTVPAYGEIHTGTGFAYTYRMDESDRVYGLGENVRGINKRGFRYVSDCSDEPHHFEDTASLYAAHNYLIVTGRETFGLFLDSPARMTFDVGFTSVDILTVTCDSADMALYVIDGTDPQDIVHQFRKLIGRSYIPPKFAFGYGQSRWGYKTAEDVREVVRQHRAAGVPLDMVYLDIDYMQDFKDFTVNPHRFPDFAAFVEEMKQSHVRLIPIIDAGVKVEKGYSVYEEGVEKGYFCRKQDGSAFVAEVWPGWVHFPDVLNEQARAWFGEQYQVLLDQGIEGFWNDMNEPAIFKSVEGEQELRAEMRNFLETESAGQVWKIRDMVMHLMNNPKDYARMYHQVQGKMICHRDVHNLYGYYMTRAAGEAFARLVPEKRILLFSRSSYIGMHRYGGIWQGDNLSWWSHLRMNLQMMPSLNMVGILYTGADIGGFGSDTSRDLLLRWLALGVFTPLMRNHSALGTRQQEFYRFEGTEDFRAVIAVRYRLIPYLYSEYMKAALSDTMMFRPLAFVYPEDSVAVETEDQMMIGDEIMIAPVLVQNASGRFVYLPERMKLLRLTGDAPIREEVMEPGVHYVKVALNEVILFIREGRTIPIGASAEYVEALDPSSCRMYGFSGASYVWYDDDGTGKDYENPCHVRTVNMP